MISIFFDIRVFWNFGWKFKFLGRICFEMGPYGSDLAQNYTQLLQIGFPTRFDGSRGPKTSIFEFLKSCNFQKIAGGAQGIPREMIAWQFSHLGVHLQMAILGGCWCKQRWTRLQIQCGFFCLLGARSFFSRGFERCCKSDLSECSASGL